MHPYVRGLGPLGLDPVPPPRAPRRPPAPATPPATPSTLSRHQSLQSLPSASAAAAALARTTSAPSLGLDGKRSLSRTLLPALTPVREDGASRANKVTPKSDWSDGRASTATSATVSTRASSASGQSRLGDRLQRIRSFAELNPEAAVASLTADPDAPPLTPLERARLALLPQLRELEALRSTELIRRLRKALLAGFETYEAAFEWMCTTHGRRGALELSRGEFGDALKTLGVTSSKVLRRLWSQLDGDGNGGVSLAELIPGQDQELRSVQELAEKLMEKHGSLAVGAAACSDGDVVTEMSLTNGLRACGVRANVAEHLFAMLPEGIDRAGLLRAFESPNAWLGRDLRRRLIRGRPVRAALHCLGQLDASADTDGARALAMGLGFDPGDAEEIAGWAGGLREVFLTAAPHLTWGQVAARILAAHGSLATAMEHMCTYPAPGCSPRLRSFLTPRDELSRVAFPQLRDFLGDLDVPPDKAVALWNMLEHLSAEPTQATGDIAAALREFAPEETDLVAMLRAALELAGDGQWRPSFARLRAASVKENGWRMLDREAFLQVFRDLQVDFPKAEACFDELRRNAPRLGLADVLAALNKQSPPSVVAALAPAKEGLRKLREDVLRGEVAPPAELPARPAAPPPLGARERARRRLFRR